MKRRSASKERVYLLEHSDEPWGDYGTVLIHGLLLGRDPQAGNALLARTLPFVTGLTFPMNGTETVVVAHRVMRIVLEKAGFTGLDFRPINITKAVRIPWERWDFEADVPEVSPDTGEPEDYILEGEDDEELRRSVVLWEFTPPNGSNSSAQTGASLWPRGEIRIQVLTSSPSATRRPVLWCAQNA